MKYITTVTIALLTTLIFNSCKKEDKAQPKVDENGLTQNIKNLIPEWILDEMKKMGMPINGGANPPDMEGIYFASPFEMIKSNIPNDNILGRDNMMTFKNQNNDELTIMVDFLINYIRPYGWVENSTGLGSFIVGKDSKFSIFADAETRIQGHTAKMVSVISGELQNGGIANLHWAGFMVDDKGDPGNVFIANGKGRVFHDKDGWSERTDR